MRQSLLAASLVALLLQLGACEPETQDAVRSGDCEVGESHCVDTETIQYCPAGEWLEPEECPPDFAGSGDIQVEILTYCGDGACRPAG